MIDACDSCLRRSQLVAFLAGDIQRLLPPGAPARAQVLAVENATLVAAASPRRQGQARRFLERFDARRARDALAARELDGACVHSDAYPPPLRDLHHPPPVIYATRLDLVTGEREPAAVVVGSRRPSEYGRTVAYRLGRSLAASGVPVISGLALGIDAVAHRGCLDASGRTVAVLACGVDMAYPRTNRGLYERILRDGAVVSEVPPGSRPYRWLFPARNRIMAALGRLTVVVEAAERSGTLITADCASEIGREVAAVPGWITADVAAGTNALLKQGASVVTHPQDVLDLLYGVGAREAREPRPGPALGGEEARVMELVTRGAPLEELIEESGVPPGKLRGTLARLELRGLVRRAPSGAYVPAA